MRVSQKKEKKKTALFIKDPKSFPNLSISIESSSLRTLLLLLLGCLKSFWHPVKPFNFLIVFDTKRRFWSSCFCLLTGNWQWEKLWKRREKKNDFEKLEVSPWPALWKPSRQLKLKAVESGAWVEAKVEPFEKLMMKNDRASYASLQPLKVSMAGILPSIDHPKVLIAL